MGDNRIGMMSMTEDQIKHMVDRFLAWKLPDSFNPDGGVSFKRLENRYHHPDASPFYPMPTGTNLLDAAQADAMVRYMLDGLPEPPAPAAGMAPSGEPKAWYYEERHTDAQGTFWSRHLDYKRPEESPRRRNITPLFLAPDVVSPAAESPSKFSPGPAVEIRKQDDAIDEIVIRRGDVHIEQMSADGWFMGVDASDGSYWQFWFGAKNRKSHVEFRHTETHHPDVADFTAPKDHFPADSELEALKHDIERLTETNSQLLAQVEETTSKLDDMTDLLKQFVYAYEEQDADNFTDSLRSAYAAADAALSSTEGNRG